MTKIYSTSKIDIAMMWAVTDEVIVGTKAKIYEGTLLSYTEEFVTLNYFNEIKDDYREVDIPLKDIVSFTSAG